MKNRLRIYSKGWYFNEEYRCWYQNGKIHREDGPAVEYSNGDKEWWIRGEWKRMEMNGGRVIKNH